MTDTTMGGPCARCKVPTLTRSPDGLCKRCEVAHAHPPDPSRIMAGRCGRPVSFDRQCLQPKGHDGPCGKAPASSEDAAPERVVLYRNGCAPHWYEAAGPTADTNRHGEPVGVYVRIDRLADLLADLLADVAADTLCAECGYAEALHANAARSCPTGCPCPGFAEKRSS